MAEIVPFPLTRRVSLVKRQAEWFCQQSPGAAAKNLDGLLRLQQETLIRKGVASDVAQAEVRGLEAAIRGEVARLQPIEGVGQ